MKDLDVNEMVLLFIRNIKNVLSNFRPHEIIICDDQDPPSINNRVEELINEKNDTFQRYRHRIIQAILSYSKSSKFLISKIKLDISKMN